MAKIIISHTRIQAGMALRQLDRDIPTILKTCRDGELQGHRVNNIRRRLIRLRAILRAAVGETERGA